jgi:hypothetical protein
VILIAFVSMLGNTAIAQTAAPETRSERVTVVNIHVGGDGHEQGVFPYTAPEGWQITDVKLHEITKGGDANYSIASRTDKEVKVAWSAHSQTVRGPFKVVLNTITAFLGLEMTVTLQKLPDPLPPPETWPKVVAVASGLAFLVAILVIAIVIRELTPFRLFVFRTVLAIAAAGFGAALPGLLHLSFSAIPNVVIEAGGAIALFVIIYKINPAQVAVSRRKPQPNRRRKSNGSR